MVGHFNRKQSGQQEGAIQLWGIKTERRNWQSWFLAMTVEYHSPFRFRGYCLLSEGEMGFPTITESEVIHGS